MPKKDRPAPLSDNIFLAKLGSKAHSGDGHTPEEIPVHNTFIQFGSPHLEGDGNGKKAMSTAPAWVGPSLQNAIRSAIEEPELQDTLELERQREGCSNNADYAGTSLSSGSANRPVPASGNDGEAHDDENDDDDGDGEIVIDAATSAAIAAGELPSAGSAKHAEGLCKRCCFFPKGRCLNSLKCEFCHFEHEKRKRKKKKKGSKRDDSDSDEGDDQEGQPDKVVSAAVAARDVAGRGFPASAAIETPPLMPPRAGPLGVSCESPSLARPLASRAHVPQSQPYAGYGVSGYEASPLLQCAAIGYAGYHQYGRVGLPPAYQPYGAYGGGHGLPQPPHAGLPAGLLPSQASGAGLGGLVGRGGVLPPPR